MISWSAMKHHEAKARLTHLKPGNQSMLWKCLKSNANCPSQAKGEASTHSRKHHSEIGLRYFLGWNETPPNLQTRMLRSKLSKIICHQSRQWLRHPKCLERTRPFRAWKVQFWRLQHVEPHNSVIPYSVFSCDECTMPVQNKDVPCSYLP